MPNSLTKVTNGSFELDDHTNDDVECLAISLKLREIHISFIRINTISITCGMLGNRTVGR